MIHSCHSGAMSDAQFVCTPGENSFGVMQNVTEFYTSSVMVLFSLHCLSLTVSEDLYASVYSFQKNILALYFTHVNAVI